MAATTLPPGLKAGTWRIEPAHSQIAFAFRTVLGRVSGQVAQFSGVIQLDDDTLGGSWVTSDIEAGSVHTGRAVGDAFLKSRHVLRAAAYRRITLVLESLEIDDEDCYLSGWLTMRGRCRPVTVQVAFLDAQTDTDGCTRAEFNARTQLLLREEWNIGVLGRLLLGESVLVDAYIRAVYAGNGSQALPGGHGPGQGV
jgi:polyisoprenoid-binding protein YceI